MDDLQELKAKLTAAAKAKNKELASRLRKKISVLTEAADESIREHLRDIDFKTKEYTVELLVHKYRDGLDEDTNELFVPDYQREFKWNAQRQSKLIESLLIGLPIPYIFTADISDEDPEFDGRIEIVDGVQRVNTIAAFVENKLELTDLQVLKSLNGFKFEDLLQSRQRRFHRIPIRVIELSEKCDEETRRDLFERINSGSLELEAQEKRHGSKLADTEFYKEVLMPCSNLAKLHELAPVSEAKKRSGEYRELVLRFFAYKEKYKKYDGEVSKFLNKYLEDFRGKKGIGAEQYIEEFNNMLDFVEEHFELGFRKTEGSNSTPRARFESISVGVALALDEDPELEADADDVSEWLISEEFKRATTSDGANNVGNFKSRITFFRDKLLG